MKKVILWLALVSSLFLFACNTNSDETNTKTEELVVSTGDTVQIEYTSMFQDGTVLESGTVVEFTLWEGTVMNVLKDSIIWQKEWFTNTISVNTWDAYGIYYDNTKIQKVPATLFNKNLDDLSIGANITLSEGLEWIIIDNSLNIITIDLNPAETRQPMDFEIRLIKIYDEQAAE